MYSIKDNTTNIEIIKKSKFIAKLYKIDNIDEAKTILNNLNKEYSDSTHICYCYIIDSNIKCSDDKEPSGTAGIPILNVLKKNDLDHILAVVIRYFGGVKLGKGGLTRAYSNSVSNALKLTSIIELKEKYLIEIEFSFDNKKIIDNILKDIDIKEIIYNNTITYKLYLNNLDFINELEKNVINLKISDKVLM